MKVRQPTVRHGGNASSMGVSVRKHGRAGIAHHRDPNKPGGFLCGIRLRNPRPAPPEMPRCVVCLDLISGQETMGLVTQDAGAEMLRPLYEATTGLVVFEPFGASEDRPVSATGPDVTEVETLLAHEATAAARNASAQLPKCW
jgi:hypothetical protein